MDTGGARFVPIVDLTHHDDDTNSHPTIPLQLPVSVYVSANNSALVTFSEAGSDFRAKCSRSPPIPNQTSGNRWQVQYRDIPSKCNLQFSEPWKRFIWLLNEHEKENFLLPLKNEVHNINMQMQARQIEHDAGARFSQGQRELLSRFSQDADQALEDQRDILATEVTSEVWRLDEQVYDWRTELSLQALQSEDITQRQRQ